MVKNIVYLLFLSCALLLGACTSEYNKIFKSQDVQYKLKMAEQFYAKKKYAQAQKIFENIFASLKGTPQYEDVYFKFAFCSFYEKDYLNAENLFKTFVETFPNSSKVEECDYYRGLSYYKQSPKAALDQSNTIKTIGLMQSFLATYPNSTRLTEANKIIDKCREKLENKEINSAQLYFELGYYKAAAIGYDNILLNFPDSKRSDEYKYKAIKAYTKYAAMSIPEKQPARYAKVLTECNDFEANYKNSKYLGEVNDYKKQALKILKTLPQ